jgi:hypothetical protein
MDIYEIREYVTENINKIKNFHRCQCYTEKQVPYLTKEFHGLKNSFVLCTKPEKDFHF